MRASELLQRNVVDRDGTALGRVRDLHAVQDGPLRASGERGFRVHGIVVGRFAVGTRLGYVSRPGVDAQQETKGPLPLRALFRWLHRNARYIPWQRVVEIGETTIVVETTEA